MHDYAVTDYGLYLSKDTMKDMAKKYLDFSEKRFEEDPFEFYDRLCNDLDLDYISEFTGEAFPIDDNGADGWGDSVVFDNEYVFFVPILNPPRLFDRAYPSVDHALLELKRNVKEFLPPDFDYRSNFRHFVGTYYG
jgi:hypothetical protein